MDQIKEEYVALERRGKYLLGSLKRRRKSSDTIQLCNQLKRGQRLLYRAVHSDPLRLRHFRDHQETYRILYKRVGRLLQHFQQHPTIPSLPTPPSSNQLDLWEACYDALEEVVEKLAWNIRTQQKTDLLAVIELIDALDRTNPNRSDTPQEICTPLLRKSFNIFQQAAVRYLARAQVRKIIDVQVGEYPSVETTRIVNDGIEGFNENIVVEKVLEEGYRWQGQLLRPAAVTVKQVNHS